MDHFVEFLAGTALADCEVATVDVDETGSCAYVLNVSSKDVDMLWSVARKLVDVTGRWPVLSVLFLSTHSDWNSAVAEADLFSRFYFNEDTGDGLVAPDQIVQKSEKVDVEAAVKLAYRTQDEYFELDNEIEFQILATQRRYGRAPDKAELLNAVSHIHSDRAKEAIESYLLEWERRHPGEGNPLDGRQDWFYDDPCALVFLPTPDSWKALAYMHWYGSIGLGSDFHVALHKDWLERYGAELCANHGTMLQFKVRRPPTVFEDAWSLANLHDQISPNSLSAPGITVRHYAAGLIGCDRWFFHERP